MSTGFVLNIPQEMLNRLEDADKKIEKLARTSEDAQTRIVSAFKSINTHGIDAFINKLTEAQTKLADLGNTKVDFSANASIFSSLTSNARKAIDEVNNVVSAIGKIKTASGETGKMQNPFLGSGISEALAKLNAEIEQVKRNFSELQNQFTHLNVPAGDKSGLTNIQNEAQFLMEYIRVLEKEKNGLIAAKNALAEANKTLQQKDPFKAKVDDLSRESLEALRYKDSMQAMKEFYAEQDKEMKKAAKEAEADRKKREKEEKATAERIATYDSKARKERYKAYTSTYEGAMRTSDRAKTLLQEQQAIKNLEAARAKLNKTDSDYANKLRNLNQRILEHKNNIDKATAGSKNLQTQHRNLMDISGQLAHRLALVFSVSQITGYVKKLIEVRGEFELQQRSLQAILQNKDEANRIWQQTVDLAVRSPFRVKELVSYTKQLAAYRIESDKLFETNKMLADISAGLGVDMQRLILALGQVRSAAYLRGTELRQFTEAGIPILEQLAQYFTELEGRAVSVGDVFERVSKRMVSFADVEEIFKRMTSEGGTFYRMQEIQAETLQGQISNLKDSVDIMLNDIGKAHQDTLASSVAFVRSVVQNWRLLATAIQQAGFALAGFSAVKIIRALRLTGDALVEATIKARGLTAATAKLKLSMMDLGKWIKAHPAFFAVGLIASATHALIQYGKSVDAMNEKYDEMSQRELRRVDTLKELNEQAQKNNQAIKDAIAEQDNASEGTDEYATAEDNLSRARGKNISLLERLKKEYPEVYASIMKQEDGTVDLTKAIEEQNRVAQRQIALQQQAKGGWFQESLTKNYEDAVEALGNYQSSLDKVAMATYEMRQNLSMALSSEQITQEEYDAISSIADRMMDIKDSVEGLNLIEEIFGTKAMSNAEINALVEPIRHALIELGETVPEYNWALGDFFDNLENLKSLPVTINEMVALDPQKGKENAGDYVESVLDEFGIVNDTIREWAKRKIEKIIGFKLVWGDGEGGGGDDELDGWAKRVKEAVDALNEEIKKKSPKIDTDDLFPVPNKNQTKEEYLAVAKDAIGVAEMTYDELQKIEDQEVVDRTKALSPFVETFRQILNLYKETKKGGGDKDTFTPMLRTVKEIYQEFKKLQGSFDDLTAKEGALAKFGDAFKEAFGKTPEQMGFDLFSQEGIESAYDYLISKAPDAKKKIQAELAKGEIVWDVKLQTKKDADKELLDDIQELFDRYDLSLELKKLNIPPDLAKSLFDVDYLDLEGLKKAVQEQEAKFIGTDMEKEYKDFLDKIGDMEDKAAKERMKTYSKYLLEGMSERVKLKIEEMRKLKEIEESDEFTPAQKERIKEGVSKEARAEQQKQEWKDFQGTEMYTMMFEDLEHYGTAAIDALYDKLSQLKTSLSDLPASEVKEIVGQIEKLENIQIERNPFEYLKKYKEEVKNIGFTEGELQTQLLDSHKAEEEAQKYIDIYNTVMQSLMSEDEGVFEEIDAETLAQWNEMLRLAEEQGKTVEEILADRKATVKAEQENQGKIVQNLNSYKKLSKAQKESLELTQEWLTQVGNLFSASKDLMESLGVESDSVAMTIANTGSSMVSLIGSAVQFTLQLDAMEIAANSALGIVGYVAIAIQAVATVLSAVFSAKDKALQAEIDGLIANAEKLHKKYEELSDAIDSAYDASVVRRFNKEIEKTIQLEIKAIEAAIAAEKSQKSKKVDWNWVAEQEEAVKQLYDTLNDERDSYIERWGGFGSESNRFDFIESMTQAWLDSFKETGDGLAGLEETWDEYFDNLAMKQMALRVSKKKVDEYLDLWDKYVSEESAAGENLTEAEAQDLRLRKEALLKELSERYTSLAESLGVTPTTEGGGLSALSKSIQGVSESTAQVLESLLSSMRFYVADSNAKLTQLLNNMMSGETESSMLAELRAQTNWMRDIYNLINGMTATHPSGGRGIKTVM